MEDKKNIQEEIVNEETVEVENPAVAMWADRLTLCETLTHEKMWTYESALIGG